MTRRELALLLPLLALFLAAWAVFPERPDDEASYVVLAERLVDGFYVTGDDDAILNADPGSPDLWFGPGLPALLAPLVAVDAPLSVLRLTSVFVLFGAVLLMYVLARERWGPRIGLGAAYALGLYVPFLGLLSNLHSEVLAVLFVVVGMLGLARFLERGGFAWLALGALGLAGLALTRVAYGWVLTVALLALVVWWLVGRSRSAGRAATVLALALALCLPWLAYTYSQTDRLFVWGNSGSLSLYWMTSPHEGDVGDWHQAHLVFTDPDLEPHRAFFETLRGLELAEQNAEIEREALRTIATIPARTPRTSSRTSRACSSTRPTAGRSSRRTTCSTRCRTHCFSAPPFSVPLSSSRVAGRSRPRPASSRCSPERRSGCTRSSPRTRGCSLRSSRSSSG